MEKTRKRRRKSSRRDQAIHLAIRKYGVENFEIEILYQCKNIEELNLKEKQAIEDYGTLSPNGYNLHSGGNYHSISEETRKKMSIVQIGKKQSETTKEKKNKKLKNRIWDKSILEKRAKSISKPVLEMTSNKVFSSLKEAAEHFGINTKGISKNLHGKSSHYFGLKFEFAEKI